MEAFGLSFLSAAPERALKLGHSVRAHLNAAVDAHQATQCRCQRYVLLGSALGFASSSAARAAKGQACARGGSLAMHCSFEQAHSRTPARAWLRR